MMGTDTEHQMSDDDLIQLIEEAFADAEFPGDRLDDIASSGNLDGRDAERVGAFLGKHWHNLSAEFLKRHCTIEFCFLTPKAFRFYLPAYLIGSIRHPVRSTSWTNTVYYHLYPPLTGPGYGRVDHSLQVWDDTMSLLSPKQKHAIRLWFEHLLERKRGNLQSTSPPSVRDLEVALANYWNQF
jgi:hypothetical protein